MMIGFRAILAAAMLLPSLAGCALFHSKQAEVQVRVPEQLAEDQYGAQQMALGRQKLDEGQYGEAVVAFRNAQHLPEHTAAAHNGMAIAYSQVGRFDLAERYFRQAMEEAPSDRRYQLNLARFYQSVPAVAVKGGSPPVATAPAVPEVQLVANSASNAVIRVELPAARTVRVSANEVRIESATPIDVRRRAPGSRTAMASQSARPVLRRNPGYPVRINLDAVK